FNLEWLQQTVSRISKFESVWDEDVQATLADLTARSIADAIRKHAANTDRILVCGGGVLNAALMRRLKGQLPGVVVESTSGHGIDPRWVEAATFAWLAKRCLDREPGNLPAVTGASRETLLGGVYYALDAASGND
ncbi:MAG: anhydro-N-acetylmuramic acid kinase, partial [Woeseiaceae bacterium]